MCAARAEFHDTAPFGGADNAVGLGGDQTLMIDQQKRHRFDQLCLNHGPAHDDQGFIGEYDGAFGHGPHIAGKFKVFEQLQKGFTENAFLSQKFKVIFRESEVLNVFDKLLQACSYGKTSGIGYRTEIQIKIRD